MSPKRIQHLAACTLFSLLIVVASVLLDLQRTGVHQTLAGLRWARQVATQAEGMVFKAREDGEKDPVNWAVSYLAQGVEPRLIRVSKVQISDSSAQASETFSIDGAAGTFEYTRILMPENGTGIHIQIAQNYIGFLGAQSALASDFMVFAYFALLFAMIFLRIGRYFGFDDAGPLRALVIQWAGGAKSQITRHGTHIREMVRESQRLAVCSGHAREHVIKLRNNIHAGLTELHESRDFYRDGETIASRAETLAQNMALEANRLGGDARRIADMATELHRRLQALHAVNRKGQSLVQRLERQVEPWATDADLAFHAFDDVKDATHLLGNHIRSTTESLVGQAKLIQGLNRELGTNGIEVKTAPQPTHTEIPTQQARARLPDPLPPLSEKDPQSRLTRKFRVLQRKIRNKKSA